MDEFIFQYEYDFNNKPNKNKTFRYNDWFKVIIKLYNLIKRHYNCRNK